MKKMKKLLAIMAASTLAVTSLAGCGGTTGGGAASGTSGGSAESKADTAESYSVGLIQLVQHEALDKATEGFMDTLEEKLGDKVKFDLQNAAGDSATCATIANQQVSSNVDLIFANATPALQAAAAATDSIPIVGTSITDYATALDIDDWTGTTGRNITGTADLAPLEEQAAMFKELLPDAKNIGLLYCSNEANSKYQIDIVAAELEKLGYTTTEYPFADSNDIAAVTTTACGSADALYIPTDNTVAANGEIVANIAVPANIPVIAGEEGICRACGIATLSISYYSLGQAAGEMAYDILVNGKDPAEMEIQYAEDLTKMYAPERAEALGITIPDDYEALAEEAAE